MDYETKCILQNHTFKITLQDNIESIKQIALSVVGRSVHFRITS